MGECTVEYKCRNNKMQKDGDYWKSIVPDLMIINKIFMKYIENNIGELGKFWNKH